MAESLLWFNILSIGIGYLLGCVSPAYLFGRLHHMDIRKVGTMNAGTTNVYQTLGILYAIPTAAYDVLKGLLALFIAQIIGADPVFVQIAGLAAIVGHVLPFYLKFKGGQGMATAMGLFLYYMVNYLMVGLQVFLVILYLVPIIVIFFYIARIGEVLSMTLFPLLGYGMFVVYPDNPNNIFFAILTIWGACTGLWNSLKLKKIEIHNETFQTHKWRVITRPFAIFFVVFYYIFSKIVALYVIGGIALVFILLDLVRLTHRRTGEFFEQRAKKVFKKGEEHRFSSITIFLIGAFISVLLFEEAIAITALVFLIFGDFFGKIFGLAFGRHKIFSKTVEGMLANYGSVLIFGYVLFTTLNIPLLVLAAGGIVAPIVEVVSTWIDDNLTVPLIAGAVMTVVAIF